MVLPQCVNVTVYYGESNLNKIALGCDLHQSNQCKQDILLNKYSHKQCCECMYDICMAVFQSEDLCFHFRKVTQYLCILVNPLPLYTLYIQDDMCFCLILCLNVNINILVCRFHMYHDQTFPTFERCMYKKTQLHCLFV